MLAVFVGESTLIEIQTETIATFVLPFDDPYTKLEQEIGAVIEAYTNNRVAFEEDLPETGVGW